MQDYNEIDYTHCILLDNTNTKILLLKEYKPLINDYVITVPTIPITYDNYKPEIWDYWKIIQYRKNTNFGLSTK